jgi:hypothetical protein
LRRLNETSTKEAQAVGAVAARFESACRAGTAVSALVAIDEMYGGGCEVSAAVTSSLGSGALTTAAGGSLSAIFSIFLFFFRLPHVYVCDCAPEIQVQIACCRRVFQSAASDQPTAAVVTSQKAHACLLNRLALLLDSCETPQPPLPPQTVQVPVRRIKFTSPLIITCR